MLILASTSDILRVVTSAAATVDIHATWADNAAGTVTPGRTNTEVTTATTTTVVGSPAASTQRTVQLLTVRNVHASVVTDVTIQHFDGATSIDMHKTTLGPGESVVYVDGSGFIRLNSAGSPVGAASLNGADVQVFTENGTWTKPTGFTPKVVIVEAIGAGGGGGGGGSLAAAVVCKGGGGGGGGAWIRGVFAASDLAATVAVTVGTGGSSGAAGAAGAAGGNGGVGGSTTFGTLLTAPVGAVGRVARSPKRRPVAVAVQESAVQAAPGPPLAGRVGCPRQPRTVLVAKASPDLRLSQRPATPSAAAAAGLVSQRSRWPRASAAARSAAAAAAVPEDRTHLPQRLSPVALAENLEATRPVAGEPSERAVRRRRRAVAALPGARLPVVLAAAAAVRPSQLRPQGQLAALAVGAAAVVVAAEQG